MHLKLKRVYRWKRKRNSKGQYVSETYSRIANKTFRKPRKLVRLQKAKKRARYKRVKISPIESPNIQNLPSVIEQAGSVISQAGSGTSSFRIPPDPFCPDVTVIRQTNLLLDEFLRKLEGAIATLYQNDSELIELQVNERAIAHRLAHYLEPFFEGKDVDCEYNRYGEEATPPKELEGIRLCKETKETDWIIPDILIHRRKSKDKDNLAVFEIKSNIELDNCDKLKLKGMTSLDGRFKYDFGIGLEFYAESYRTSIFLNGEQLGEALLRTGLTSTTNSNKRPNDRKEI